MCRGRGLEASTEVSKVSCGKGWMPRLWDLGLGESAVACGDMLETNCDG